MAIAGPRLDRPSAIGDEGRPRATSLALATLVLLVAAAVAGRAVGEVTMALGLAAVAGPAAAGFALLDRERFSQLFAGYALTLWFGTALVVLLIAAPLTGQGDLVAVGVTLSLFGIGLTWGDAGDRETLTRAVVGAGIGSVSILLGTVVAALALVGLGVALTIVDGTAAAVPGAGHLLALALATGYALGGVAAAMRWVPLEALAPPDRQADAAALLRRIRLSLVGIGGVVVFVLLSVPAYGVLSRVGRLPPPPDALQLPAPLGTGGPAVLVVIGSLCLLVGLLALAVRTQTKRREVRSMQRLAAMSVGLASFLLIAIVGGLFALAVPVLWVVVASLLLAPLLFLTVGFLTLVVGALGFLPDRSGGPALAATGLVVAAIGLRETDPIATVVCVAAAVVVWELSWYGLGITAELGHLPDTRRLELVHGLSTIAVGAVTVVAALGAIELIDAIGPVGGPTLMVIAVTGAVLLLLPLRE